jgi:hypothetical protein
MNHLQFQMLGEKKLEELMLMEFPSSALMDTLVVVMLQVWV